MKGAKFRIYVDTSVIGGCLDDEFSADSNRLLEAAKKGQIVFVVSEIVVEELEKAPDPVKAVFDSIPEASLEVVPRSTAVAELANAYLVAKVVGQKSRNDATHVAYATVARVDAIVSWNFKDIVRLDRMKGYNRVNFEEGYGIIEIVSPKEVVTDD